MLIVKMDSFSSRARFSGRYVKTYERNMKEYGGMYIIKNTRGGGGIFDDLGEN